MCATVGRTVYVHMTARESKTALTCKSPLYTPASRLRRRSLQTTNAYSSVAPRKYSNRWQEWHSPQSISMTLSSSSAKRKRFSVSVCASSRSLSLFLSLALARSLSLSFSLSLSLSLARSFSARCAPARPGQPPRLRVQRQGQATLGVGVRLRCVSIGKQSKKRSSVNPTLLFTTTSLSLSLSLSLALSLSLSLSLSLARSLALSLLAARLQGLVSLLVCVFSAKCKQLSASARSSASSPPMANSFRTTLYKARANASDCCASAANALSVEGKQLSAATRASNGFRYGDIN